MAGFDARALIEPSRTRPCRQIRYVHDDGKGHAVSEIEECVGPVQAVAYRGGSVEDVLDAVVGCLGKDLTVFTFIAVLFEAFKVPVRTLREVEDWERIGGPGGRSTGEVTSMLRPWIEGFGSMS